MDAAPGDLLLLVADEWMTACEVLGQLRNDLGRPPVHEGPYRYVWVVDFPMFVGVSEDGRPKPAHHPFTRPHPDDIDKLETDPMSRAQPGVRPRAQRLGAGLGLASGSTSPSCSSGCSTCSASSEEEAQRRFGFFLTPFRYGAPPHGGFAFGIDRLVAILAGEENIREVIAFPKTQSGVDPMTDSPTPVDRTPARRARPPRAPPAVVAPPTRTRPSLSLTDLATPTPVRPRAGWPER